MEYSPFAVPELFQSVASSRSERYCLSTLLDKRKVTRVGSEDHGYSDERSRENAQDSGRRRDQLPIDTWRERHATGATGLLQGGMSNQTPAAKIDAMRIMLVAGKQNWS
jgi:hypothetical protein